jgi:hypothetical protein
VAISSKKERRKQREKGVKKEKKIGMTIHQHHN